MSDPTQLMIYRNLLSSIAEEMGVVLQKTSYSPNIKERRDYSCALFDHQGQLLAQAAHIPVHLGAFSISIRAAMEEVTFEPGDTVIMNDPYRGGTHLPDISLITGVFLSGKKPTFYVANRAHHADVGGLAPGSMAPATDILQEGIRIPPVKIEQGGALRKDVLQLLLANVRTPQEREGDLRAQLAANTIGTRRLTELAKRKGLVTLQRSAKNLLLYSEKLMRAAIRTIPNGTYEFEDRLDDDGQGTVNIPIRVRLRIAGEKATFDFHGSSPQVKGCVNATKAITISAVQYALCSAVGIDIPINEGALAPVTTILPEDSVVNSSFPGATAAGNVETSQRIVDVLLGALAKALPGKIPAASCGSMSNLTLGGTGADGVPFSYYETLAGGAGAGPTWDGQDAVQTHMTNTLNTPVEALEIAYPFRVIRNSIRTGSGGEGDHPGGNGLIREIELLAPARMGLLTERRILSPYGLDGGKPGQTGKNLLKRKGKSTWEKLPGKAMLTLEAGDIIRIETPGGGGYGKETTPRKKAIQSKSARSGKTRKSRA